MELRQLRHFITVGELGSITAAAKKLRLTQPALSRQMKALEDELDTPLLDRGAHSIRLTPAGELLLAEAGKLVRYSDQLAERVRAAALGEPLRVGYSPSLAGDFLSVAIGRFSQLHPRVRVSLFDWSSAEMRDGLADGKLDLIVAAPCPGLREPIRWTPLRQYGWQLVLPADHELAGRGPIAPADLDGQRLLLYERDSYPDYWDRVTGFFRSHGVQAKVAGEFDGISSLLAGVEGNLGVALLATSSPVDPARRERILTRPLAVQPPAIEVAAGISDSRETSAQLLAFIEELKRAGEDHWPAAASSP